MGARYARSSGIEAAPLQDETILYNAATNKFCVLNGTAAFLWERLRDPCTVEQLSAELCAQYEGVEPAHAAADVRTALQQLTDLAMVVTQA